MRQIPEEKRRKGEKDCNLFISTRHIERALGVHWCVENDTFGLSITLTDQPDLQ